MKRLLMVILFAVFAFPANAFLYGELDPALEREYSIPPTFSDCYRLGWIRGVHFEIHGEQEAWMKQCLAGKVPFHLDGRQNRHKKR